jgi:hypothetical protein
MLNVKEIHQEALSAALSAEKQFIEQYGEPMYCGFAWVKFYVDGRSSFAKELVAAGIAKKSWDKGYDIWNPTGTGSQSMDVREAGSAAYAAVWKSHGVKCYMESRAD